MDGMTTLTLAMPWPTWRPETLKVLEEKQVPWNLMSRSVPSTTATIRQLVCLHPTTSRWRTTSSTDSSTTAYLTKEKAIQSETTLLQRENLWQESRASQQILNSLRASTSREQPRPS